MTKVSDSKVTTYRIKYPSGKVKKGTIVEARPGSVQAQEEAKARVAASEAKKQEELLLKEKAEKQKLLQQQKEEERKKYLEQVELKKKQEEQIKQKSKFEELYETPYGEAQRKTVSQLKEEQIKAKLKKYQLEPKTAESVKERIGQKEYTQTFVKKEESKIDYGKPELTKKEQEGVKKQLREKEIRQTPSTTLEEYETVKPTMKGEPVTELVEGVTYYPKTIAKGIGEIFKAAYIAGGETRKEQEAGFSAKQIAEFRAREAGRLIAKPEVQAVATLGVLSVAPPPITALAGGIFVSSELERFMQNPTLKQVGELAFLGATIKAPKVVKEVKSGLQTAKIAKKFKGKVVLRKDLAPEIINRGLSLDVKGRPVTGVIGEQYTIAGKSGTVRKTKIKLKMGELESIDMSIKSPEYVLARGKEATMTYISTARETTLPMKSRPNIAISERPVARLTKQSDILNLLKTEQTGFVSREGVVRYSTSKGGILKETLISSKKIPTTARQYKVAEYEFTPFKLSESTAIQTVKPKYTRKEAKDIKMIGGKESEVFLIEEFIPKKKITEPIIIRTPTLIRIYNPETKSYFELKSTKGKTFDWIKPSEEIKDTTKKVVEPIKTTESKSGMLILEPPETIKVSKQKQETTSVSKQKQETKSISKQEQISSTLGKETTAIDSIMGKGSMSKAESKSKIEEAYKLKYKTGIILNIKSKIDTISKSGQISKSKAKQAQKPISDTIQDIAQMPDIISKSKVDTIQQTDITTKQESIQTTIQTTQPIDIFQRETYRYKKEIEDLKVPSPFKIGFDNNNKENIFTAEYRRRGKFLELGQFETPREAYLAARKKIKLTASAAGRIKKGKDIFDISFTDREFRRSKKEKGVFIQRREFRISSPGEKLEIPGAAKKKAKGQSMFKNIFGGK